MRKRLVRAIVFVVVAVGAVVGGANAAGALDFGVPTVGGDSVGWD